MFQSLATMDETTSSNAMAIDLYVNAKAANAGIAIDAVETYAFRAASLTASPLSTRRPIWPAAC